jgi:hypothetical protein
MILKDTLIALKMQILVVYYLNSIIIIILFISTSISHGAQISKKSIIHIRDKPIEVAIDNAAEVFGLEPYRRPQLPTVFKPTKFINNQFVAMRYEWDYTVIDHATGLMWERSGSIAWLTYSQAEAYVRELNLKRFAGYNDWRLPTTDELLSLLQQTEEVKGEAIEGKRYIGRYINPIFDFKQQWCWSCDIAKAEFKGRSLEAGWVVDFINSWVSWQEHRHYLCWVRSVRTFAK